MYDKDKKILAVDHSPCCNYWCNVRADASAGGLRGLQFSDRAIRLRH